MFIFFRFLRLWLLSCCWKSYYHNSWMLSYYCSRECSDCVLSDKEEEVSINWLWFLLKMVCSGIKVLTMLTHAQEIFLFIICNTAELISITWVNVLYHSNFFYWNINTFLNENYVINECLMVLIKHCSWPRYILF